MPSPDKIAWPATACRAERDALRDGHCGGGDEPDQGSSADDQAKQTMTKARNPKLFGGNRSLIFGGGGVSGDVQIWLRHIGR